MNPNGRHFRIEDCREIQERYDKVKSNFVREYEQSLNGKILKFFKLKKKDKNENIKFSDVINIIRYKLYVKPKRKIACFMWEIPYDIYHLVNRR
jgi:effector-binding domain-containing protein